MWIIIFKCDLIFKLNLYLPKSVSAKFAETFPLTKPPQNKGVFMPYYVKKPIPIKAEQQGKPFKTQTMELDKEIFGKTYEEVSEEYYLECKETNETNIRDRFVTCPKQAQFYQASSSLSLLTSGL